MITEQEMIEEYIRVINRAFPKVGELLSHCYVTVIQSFWGRPRVNPLPYIAIYCPESKITFVKEQIDVLREVAKHVGLNEAVCLNATNLLRDPKSKFKDEYPRLWLELHWMLTQEKQHSL